MITEMKMVKCPACHYKYKYDKDFEERGWLDCPKCKLPYSYFEWIDSLIRMQYMFAEDGKYAYFYITRNGKELRFTIRKELLSE